MDKPPHIAIIPSPGRGHLIPLVEFAKKLSSVHNLSTTFIIPNEGPLSISQYEFLDSLPNAITYTLLPPVNFHDLPPHAKIETRITLMVARSITSLRQTISSMIEHKNIVALFVDLFGTDAFDVAVEFGVPHYLFFPASAMTLSLFLHLPELDQTVSCEYGMARGIVVNSFKELEGGPIEALQEERPGRLPVYPVGPLIRSGSVELILETIVLGVPMIVWPLYAKQKMNVVMLTEGLKVALRAKSNENGLVEHLEIVRVIKGLLQGEEGKGI
ncbi:hypothetical protein L1987_63064 [Smallanthus sonchifolius]|uniref:Uncharacterized protein n=1 Tax=Smallanthus sonchifolius TaxID=185202 RepID=A0ACB9CC76_9ASTR|nr:hypothetical protein L1987_63064 [Smallanthus sonchifolius]